MKSKVIYLSFFLFITVRYAAFPQYQKNTNIAVIETDNLTGYRLYRECLDILQHSGWNICHKNSKDLVFTTNSYFLKNSPILVYYRLNIYDSLILLRGYVMDLNKILREEDKRETDHWERSAFQPVWGSIRKMGFSNMILVTEKIRRSISGKVTWCTEDI